MKKGGAVRLKNLEEKYDNAYRWQWRYLLPIYWLQWLVLGLSWLLGRLPFPCFLWLGKRMGILLMHLLKKRRRIAEKNIRLCLPELCHAEIQQLVRRNFEFGGITLLELGLVWFASQKRYKKLYRIEGLEHFNRLQQEGKTVLLCGLHMLCLEAMVRMLGEHINMGQLYRVHKYTIQEYISGVKRASYPAGVRMISRKRIRDFIYFMKNGLTGSVIPDHDLGRKSSLFVPFFGHMAATVPVVSVYAKKTKAVVLFMDHFLDEKKKQYVLRLSAPLENFPTDDIYADTLRINQWVEKKVREHPEQYLWMHRRFKTRPDKNDPSLY